jgi:hypothetical protein
VPRDTMSSVRMSRARPLACSVALLVTALAVRASAQSTSQTTAPPKAIIIGQVVDASSGQAIPSAIVTLDRSTSVMTTSNGRFVFRNLDPGNYRLSATKAGYRPTESGEQRPRGDSRSVIIAAGQRRRDVVIRLWRHAAITGTVIDEAGEPVIGVSVRALRRTTVGGRVRFEMEGFSGSTDDRGMYRIARLGPGAYVVFVRTSQVTLPAVPLEQAKDSFIQAMFGRGQDGDMRLQQSLMAISGFGGVDGNGFQTRRIGDHVQMIVAAPGGKLTAARLPDDVLPECRVAARCVTRHRHIGSGTQRREPANHPGANGSRLWHVVGAARHRRVSSDATVCCRRAK